MRKPNIRHLRKQVQVCCLVQRRCWTTFLQGMHFLGADGDLIEPLAHEVCWRLGRIPVASLVAHENHSAHDNNFGNTFHAMCDDLQRSLASAAMRSQNLSGQNLCALVRSLPSLMHVPALQSMLSSHHAYVDSDDTLCGQVLQLLADTHVSVHITLYVTVPFNSSFRAKVDMLRQGLGLQKVVLGCAQLQSDVRTSFRLPAPSYINFVGSLYDLQSLSIDKVDLGRFVASALPQNLSYLSITRCKLAGNFSSTLALPPTLTYLDLSFNVYTQRSTIQEVLLKLVPHNVGAFTASQCYLVQAYASAASPCFRAVCAPVRWHTRLSVADWPLHVQESIQKILRVGLFTSASYLTANATHPHRSPAVLFRHCWPSSHRWSRSRPPSGARRV